MHAGNLAVRTGPEISVERNVLRLICEC
jgi:hypothetical protein